MRSKSKLLHTAMILAMSLCLCGCGSNGDTGSGADDGAEGQAQVTENTDQVQETGEDEAEAPEEGTAAGYVFEANDVAVKVDADMDELAPQLGESKSVFEAPSCAGEGIDYIYNYSSYEIETYPAADGKNRIGRITLKDDTVATAEGIDLSMTREDVIGVYGENYEENGTQITYESNGTKLTFIFEGDSILSIEYVSAVLG